MTGQPPSIQPRRHKVAVTGSTNPQGQQSPLSFTWRKKNYVITSWGRRWTAEDGEHFLVMTAEGRMFELVHHSQDGAWFLRRAAPARTSL